MSYEAAVLVIAAVALLLLALMAFGWSRRTRRDRGLVPPNDPLPLGSDVIASYTGFYVATTVHDDALERLAVRGLGFRARADLSVTDAGVVLHLAGSDPLFLKTARLRSAEQATVAIDRVVEKDGLLRLTWTLDDGTPVDSFFRPREASARAAASAITSLLTPSTSTGIDA